MHETTHQPLLSTLSSVVETVVNLRSQGHKVVLVSSGAIGVGLKRMNMASRPKSLSGKQASSSGVFNLEALVIKRSTGIGSYWSRPAYCALGQSVWSVGTADRTSALDSWRHIGCVSRICGDRLKTADITRRQRTRYLNAVNTFKELLSMGVVPIVNENDTVSVSVSRGSSVVER